MKIAIFGDSFAHTDPDLEHRAWYTHLKNSGHDVTVFSKTGSSLWYSYDQFIKNHNNFDKCIFLVTNWGRYYFPEMKQPHWPGIRQIEVDMNNPNISTHERNILISAYNWSVFARNDNEVISYHELMIKDISLTRPDTLIIPCFNFEMSRVSNWTQQFSMFEIQLIDLFHYKIDYQDNNGIWQRKKLKPAGRELRACHLNDANNKIFSEKILEWIDTGILSMKLSDFVKPIEPVNYYFELED